jgi:NAD/NADP transhydrogenase beta subunit
MQIMGINLGIGSLTIIVFILVMLLSQLREKKFRFWYTVITMTLMIFVTFIFVNFELPVNANYVLLLAGGLVGLLLGLAIAHHIKIKIADDGSLLMKGSFLSVGIWIFIILAKFYGQNTFDQWQWNPNFLLSLFLVLSVTTMVSRNIYVYIRYRSKKKEMEFKSI